MNGRRKSSSLQRKDSHLLGMEHLGLFDPFCNGSGDRGHRKNHCCELLVESQGKLVDEGDIVGDTCLRGKVLEVSDILLKPIVHNAIRAFEGFLSELGELETRSCFGIIGEKGRFEIGCEFVKSLLRAGDRSIRHSVIPHFGERDSASLAHLIECGHDFVGVRSVNRGIDGKVGLHGFNPLYCIGGFS